MKKTTKKIVLTLEEIELLDKILLGLDLLIPLFNKIPGELGKKLRRKLRSMRNKANLPESKIPKHYYSYNSNFLIEFLKLSAKFINNNRFNDDYAKRRLGILASYTNSLLENYLKETA